MATTLSRTWWGEKFLRALEAFTDPARLGRGRSYAHGRRIESCRIEGGKVVARVRGSVNPYFGIYKEPLYTTTVKLSAIPSRHWNGLIDTLGRRAGLITRLLLNEMPESIEAVFRELRLNLLPAGPKDFTTDCSCPDYANPCKHVAGVCFVLAGQLDQDPLMLFELRGLSRDQLRAALMATPLGRALAQDLTDAGEPAPEPVTSYYTRPQRTAAAEIRYADFWGEHSALPPEPPPASVGLPAVLIRKAGDYPPFWDRDRSFVETMVEFYERVRKANKDGL